MSVKKIKLETVSKRMLADVFTPVGIYLRLRDRFRDTVLLESTDHHVAENSYSFIGVNAIAGMELSSTSNMEFKLPGQIPEKAALKQAADAPPALWDFVQRFEIEPAEEKEVVCAQGLYGHPSVDAVEFFASSQINPYIKTITYIPL